MKTALFEVLSPQEIQQIHAASMQVLSTVGVKVDYPVAHQIFASFGARVDRATQSVRIPEELVMQAIAKAPRSFNLHGADGKFNLQVGGEAQAFFGCLCVLGGEGLFLAFQGFKLAVQHIDLLVEQQVSTL